MKIPAWVIVLMALLCLTACSKKDVVETTTTATPKHSTPIDPTTVATITGVVDFAGTPPVPQKLDMSQDPSCGSQAHFDESVVVNQGHLANVLVYLKDDPWPNADIYFPAPSQPVVITQKTCRYEPHVAAAMVRQLVQIENADPTTHNIHMMPKESRQWNESQMPSAPPIEKRFDHPEIMIPIQCNQHPWMRMYLSVMTDPFFTITGPDGHFEIRGLPPGTYTFAAVHEKLGEQDMKVTVSPKESKSVVFTFKPVP